MLNQSFTVSNFRKVFDYENRKGYYLEGRFYPEIEKITNQLKDCATQFKELNTKRDAISPEDYEHEKSKLNAKKDSLKNKKEDLLIKELNNLCDKINNREYQIDFNKFELRGKDCYRIEKNNIPAYFIVKQIQYTLRKIYKVKQSNRYNIICQLMEILNNSFPKCIIRIDIKDFYESIPQNEILNKINKDSLLLPFSKKIIQDIFSKYNELTRKDVGIPRGIGISAYLSELYLREFDNAIKKHSDIIFYSRYVDDIIVIYSPEPHLNISNFLDTVLSYIQSKASELGLSLNEQKTKKINLTTGNGKFYFLGYEFLLKGGKLQINISYNKKDRYKKRIDLSFDEYKRQSNNEKVARKLLINRLRFITGNTRLSNNKDNVLTGIYFSNNLLSDSSSLEDIDNHLQKKIELSNLPDRAKKRLLKMTFKSGWEQKRFYSFSCTEIKKIVNVWKNV
jgi:hypothetical protein